MFSCSVNMSHCLSMWYRWCICCTGAVRQRGTSFSTFMILIQGRGGWGGGGGSSSQGEVHPHGKAPEINTVGVGYIHSTFIPERAWVMLTWGVSRGHPTPPPPPSDIPSLPSACRESGVIPPCYHHLDYI